MPSDKPLVSIIIPVVNNLKYNRDCLESIFTHTPADIACEIVVVDNNSKDGSREYFASLGDKIKLICNDSLRTFAQSCNQGAANAAGELLLFLNNDTYVTPGWLEPMIECLRSRSDIGIVGNKHLFPKTQLLSHAGGVFNPQKIPEHIYHFFDPELPFLNQDRAFQWVTACCLLIPHDLFIAVKGFDEQYKNSYEDVDLCFKVRNRGLKVFYCHGSVIYHYGQATTGRSDHENANQKIFWDKWWNKIQRDQETFYKQDGLPWRLERQHNLERTLYRLYNVEQRMLYLEKEIKNRDDKLHAVLSTVSWKLTHPIRITKQFILKMTKTRELPPIKPALPEIPPGFQASNLVLSDKAFFEIADPVCSTDSVAKEIFANFEKRNIPLDFELNFVERYSPDYFTHFCTPSFKTQFKLFCSNLPRWLIVIFKIFPFYRFFRDRLKINVG